MKHGPIALIDPKTPTVFLVPQDSMYDKTMANLAMIRARKGPIIALATEGDEQIKNNMLVRPFAEGRCASGASPAPRWRELPPDHPPFRI